MISSHIEIAGLACMSAAALLGAWRWGAGRAAGARQPSLLVRSWWLWGCFLCSGVLASALVALAGGEPGESTLGYLAKLFERPDGMDSWEQMLRASKSLSEHPDVPLYQSLFFEGRSKFQYPVTSLLVIDLPSEIVNRPVYTIVIGLQYLSRACAFAIGIVFAMLLCNAAAQEAPARARPSALQYLGFGLLGILGVMLFYPITRSEDVGQIQTMLTLGAALALLAWQTGRHSLAGLLVGLCCIVKPHWGIVVLWAALRKEWGFARAALGVIVAFVAAAVFMYGFRNLLDYIPVVSYIGRHGESFFANQSVNGLLNRWLFNGNNADWDSHTFAPYHPLVHAATVGSSFALLGLALAWRRTQRATAIDLALVMLALTMASPVAWEHHYGVLLPIFALLIPAVLRARDLGRGSLVALWVAYLLASQSFTHLTNQLADTRWNVLQSTLFAGALIVLVLLCRSTRLQAPRAPVLAEATGA